MNVRDLMSSWESASHKTTGGQSYQLDIPLKDAARIEALVGLYPGLNRDEVITQLIAVALDEVERQMPYKQGKKVVCLDEMGDPMYEDVGLTPKYLKLRHQFAQSFHSKKKSA